MARKTDVIKEKILNEVLSMTELENIMAEFEFIPVEDMEKCVKMLTGILCMAE